MLWLNMLVVVATVLAYCSPYISPIRNWIFLLFGLIYPWLLIFNILFIVFWFFSQKKKYAIISFVCILLGISHVKSFIGFDFFNKNKKEETITIVSYNIRNLIGLRIKERIRTLDEKKFQNFIDFLKRGEEIPILCTQESQRFSIDKIREKFNFPNYYHKRRSGTTIFSKYEIITSGEVEINNTYHAGIWADLKIGESKIRVYNLHLRSNKVTGIADKVAKDGNLGKETIKDIGSMLNRFQSSAKMRAEQAEEIVAHISSCPHPVIVCGDFNDTPQSYTYEMMTKKLNDSFREKGKGIGTTFAGKIPLLRIDYILTNENIKVHSHEVLKGNFSDHYPVISKISVEY